MKKLTISADITVYDSEKELPIEYQKILSLAHESLKDAYAPYSNFKVGAALLLNNNEMIKGTNQENASYPVCICAERVALSAAASFYPQTPIKAIAITAKSASVKINQPISPCGTCRQFMSEVEDKHKQSFQVILQGETGPVYVINSVKDLLPLSFNGSFL